MSTFNFPAGPHSHHNPIDFGTALIHTGDLDPIYIMLYHAGMALEQKKRWCVAYWLFYHAGVASAASELEGKEFWKYLAKDFKTFPRGAERRHFRTESAKLALSELTRKFPLPEAFPDYVAWGSRAAGAIREAVPRERYLREPSEPKFSANVVSYCPGFREITLRAREHRQFGPWIAFKVADMLERVLGVPVDFTDCDLLNLYAEPRAGAELAGRYWRTSGDGALYKLTKYFREQMAPPDYQRTVNIQELETIFCKYKSHLHGHYPIGKDTIEVEHALHSFHCPTSVRLIVALRANTSASRRALV